MAIRYSTVRCFPTAIFSILALVKLSTSSPVTVDSVQTGNCLQDLVRISGVLNVSQVVQILAREGVDELILSTFGDFRSADERLRTYGISLAIQRYELLNCVLPSLKSSQTSPCSNHRGPCGHGFCRLSSTGQSYTYKCRCNDGYGGKKCRKELNECELHDPCKNGATCEDRPGNYTCHCVQGYYGKNCETDKNECASAPCFHGDCVDVVNGYRCECHSGYTGELCEKDIDECRSNPCVHGSCKEGINSFTCNCQPGFTGTLCNKNIDECASSPCQFSGTCHDAINDYTCRCLHGYTGKNCEIELGPTYVRWGRTVCPPSSELVYNGSVAGQYYTHNGGGSNHLCLPPEPIYDRYSDYKWGGILHRAEYELVRSKPYSQADFHERDIPCAVCMATGKTEMLMLPARNVCPDGWVKEYHGYLMSEHYTHKRTQYVCVDDDIEAIPGTQANTNGVLFYPVSYECLGHCPPNYVNARELTCSVCSR